MKEISAGGVVFRRIHKSTPSGAVEIQMIRDRFGRMTLAKGKMEPGETIEQTALREINEETGVNGEIREFLEQVGYTFEKPGVGPIEKEVHYYLVEAAGGTLQAQLEEIGGVAWYTPAEAWRLQVTAGYDNNESVLRKALQALCCDTVLEPKTPSMPKLELEPAGQTPFDLSRLPFYIDHTLLKPDARKADIVRLCEEAVQYGFRTVCVNSGWVSLCSEELRGTAVGISAVVGFPLGASMTEVKAFEAVKAVIQGATEIDMVLPIGKLLDGDEQAVYDDIAAVVGAVSGKAIVKVILETSLLTDERKEAACRLAEKAGAHFVKTSTGFSGGGATVEDVRLMRSAVSSHMGVKASGGVRDLTSALLVIEAGASRIGTSSGVQIVSGTAGAPSIY